MDSISRNEIFLENEGMIWRVMRHNWPLICALRLDRDDVYQELAMAALSAIDNFDPARSECIQAHIWMKLQCVRRCSTTPTRFIAPAEASGH